MAYDVNTVVGAANGMPGYALGNQTWAQANAAIQASSPGESVSVAYGPLAPGEVVPPSVVPAGVFIPPPPPPPVMLSPLQQAQTTFVGASDTHNQSQDMPILRPALSLSRKKKEFPLMNLINAAGNSLGLLEGGLGSSLLTFLGLIPTTSTNDLTSIPGTTTLNPSNIFHPIQKPHSIASRHMNLPEELLTAALVAGLGYEAYKHRKGIGKFVGRAVKGHRHMVYKRHHRIRHRRYYRD